MENGYPSITTDTDGQSTVHQTAPPATPVGILTNSWSKSLLLLPGYFAACFCILLFSGCTTPAQKTFTPRNDYVPISQIQIMSRFASVEVTPDNLGYEVRKCIPPANPASKDIKSTLEDFPNRNIIVFGHSNSSKQFVLHQTTGFCLEHSSEKYPIFAAEAFLMTVNPNGVPPDVTDNWYKQVALLIATKGMARVAYVFENGNAFVVSYWVEASSLYRLHYSSIFSRAGTWETQTIDARFSHPTLTSVSETKISGSSEKKYPLAHRTK